VEEGRSLELSYYVAVLRRRWRVVVCGLLVGVIGSIGYLFLAPKTVTATSTVNVNVISSQPFNTEKPQSQLLDTQTEVQIATSSQVLTGAANELGNGLSLTQMRARTTVQPVAGATVVKISYAAPTERQAVDGADAIATAYLKYRSDAAATKVAQVITKLQRQRDNLARQLKGANAVIFHAAKGSAVGVQAETDRQLINIELTSLVSQINQLDSVDTSGGTLLSGAAENSIKYSPAPKLVVGAGILLGLIGGVLVAFAVNAFDRRVADGRVLSGLGGGEVLAQLKSHRTAVPAEGADLDQIRALRERLLATNGRGGNLVVIDLAIRDRPSDVAVNLALSVVESGDPVRLVLPDHSEEHLQLLGRSLDLQPIEAATDTWSYRSARAPGLEVVFTHEDRALGAPGARLGNILSEAHQADLTTLVALPPQASRSLWLTAGRLGHSIILVAARRETRVRAVRQLVSELGAVGAVIHGSVLVPRRRTVEMKPARHLAQPPATDRPSSPLMEHDEAAVEAHVAAPQTSVPTSHADDDAERLDADEIPFSTPEDELSEGYDAEDEIGTDVAEVSARADAPDTDTPLDFEEDSSVGEDSQRRGVASGRS
jgi:capsular polysaccharide biosynthesis protein